MADSESRVYLNDFKSVIQQKLGLQGTEKDQKFFTFMPFSTDLRHEIGRLWNPPVRGAGYEPDGFIFVDRVVRAERFPPFLDASTNESR